MRWVGAFFLVCLPLLFFWTASRLTDIYFQARLIPYPFERIGLAVGAGTALWMLALVFPVISRLTRK